MIKGSGVTGHESRNGLEQESELEHSLAVCLEKMVLEFAYKINEGENAIILRINTETVPEEIISTLRKAGINLESEHAIKLLKIYSAGTGRQEQMMQTRAQNIIGKNKEKFALVPGTLLYKDIRLTPEARQQLRSLGLKITGSRVEMIVMDFVNGEDVATILYKEALVRKFPELYSSVEDLRALSFDRLESETVSALGFKRPGGKATNEGEREFEKRKINMENVRLLLHFLRTKNFVLDKSIVKRLRASVNILHANGLAHRDLHERNVMISGPYEAGSDTKDSTVVIIDFGTAKEFSGEYSPTSEAIYSDPSGYSYLNDEIILSVLDELSMTREERIAEENKKASDKVLFGVQSLRRDKNWSNSVNTWFKENRLNEKSAERQIAKFYDYYVGTSNGDWQNTTRWTKFTDYILQMIQRRILPAKKASAQLSLLSQKEERPFAIRSLADLVRTVDILEQKNEQAVPEGSSDAVLEATEYLGAETNAEEERLRKRLLTDVTMRHAEKTIPGDA